MTKLMQWAMLICIAVSTPGCFLTNAVWDPAKSTTAANPTTLGAYRDGDGRQRLLLGYSAGDVNPKWFYTDIALNEDGFAVYPFGFTATTTQPTNDEYAAQRYQAAHADLGLIDNGTAERIITAHHFVKPPPSEPVYNLFMCSQKRREPSLPYKVAHAGNDLKIEPPDGSSQHVFYVIVPDKISRKHDELALERIKAAVLTPPAFVTDFVIDTVVLTVILIPH